MNVNHCTCETSAAENQYIRQTLSLFHSSIQTAIATATALRADRAALGASIMYQPFAIQAEAVACLYVSIRACAVMQYAEPHSIQALEAVDVEVAAEAGVETHAQIYSSRPFA